MPFLLHDGSAYLSLAFEFSRVFLYEWTVNWRFVPEKTFLSREFATALLLGHAGVLLAAVRCWTKLKPIGGLSRFVSRIFKYPSRPAALAPLDGQCKCLSVISSQCLAETALPLEDIVTVFFVSNLIGMLFARSLHYQFYVWEAHQLVFLAWQTGMPLVLKSVANLLHPYAVRTDLSMIDLRTRGIPVCIQHRLV